MRRGLHLPLSGVRAGAGPRRMGCHTGRVCACECARVCPDMGLLTQSHCRARRGVGQPYPELRVIAFKILGLWLVRTGRNLEFWPLAVQLGKLSPTKGKPVGALSSNLGHLSLVLFDIKILLLLNFTSLSFCPGVKISWGISGDTSRGRRGQRACDPQGCQTLAPTPGSRDHAL